MRYLVIAYIMCSLTACKEKLESITTEVKPLVDTTYINPVVETPQQRVVLLEEFTGVQCSNCPQGHVESKRIEDLNPDKFVVLALHSNFLGNPYSFSPQDLRTNEAEKLYQYSAASSKPSAMVDRKLFSGETIKSLGKNKWSGYVTSQLAATPPVNIDITNSYSDATRKVRISMKLTYTADAANTNKFLLYLSESNIVAPQLDGITIDTFYNHQHVLRKMVTDYSGQTITASLVKGRTIIKDFEIDIPTAWKPENVSVVASVLSVGSSSEEIIQTASKKIK